MLLNNGLGESKSVPVDGQQFDAHEIIPPENHESVFNVSSLSVKSAITLTVDEDVFDHIRICTHGAVARTFLYT